MQPTAGSDGHVRVVTDSTADLSAQAAGEYGIEVVPLQVIVDGEPKVEGVEIGPHDVAEALRSHLPVSTSRPSSQAFLELYRRLAADGASRVVSVHLSGELSGTVDAARLAAKQAPVPIEVVDSRSLGMGLGFAVLAAAEAAARGEQETGVAAAAAERAAASTAFFYVDTLEYLRMGGRIGAAAAMVGTALAIKPLLYLDDGMIKPLEKVRTGSRALARLEDLAVAWVVERTGVRAGETTSGAEGEAPSVSPPRRLSGAGPGALGEAPAVDVAVHHLDNAARAEALARRLSERLPGLGEMVVSEVGAVIGAHVGPGLLAVVLSPR